MAERPVQFSPPVEPAGRFVITGPTGWIGRALLGLLHDPADPDRLVKGESVALFGSRSATLRHETGAEFAIRPLGEITVDDVADAHVIHLAFLTKDRLAETGTESFRASNRAIDSAVLDACASAPPRSLFVASSGAAAQAEQASEANPYGHAKLEQEARFLQYAAKSKVPILCVRVYNLAGPYINKLDAYAIGNFTLQALDGGPIRISAPVPVYRSFLHVTDLCRLIVRSSRGGVGMAAPIDMCGEDPLEMSDIATLVIEAFGLPIQIERPHVNPDAASRYLGNHADTKRLANRLGVDLAGTNVQVRETVEWICNSDQILDSLVR